MRTREILAAARRDGKAAGKAKASWAFDGNTKTETYKRFLAGYEDCDPQVLDSYCPPDLSGQWADDPTERSLAEDYDIDERRDPDGSLISEVGDVWLEAAHRAYYDELVRVARIQVRP